MTSRDHGGPTRHDRFAEFYRAHFADLSRFVYRRVEASDASDVIAQVFTVAWRRFDQVPSPPEDRLWLFGVARRTVADHRRSSFRRLQMHHRLFSEVRPAVADHDPDPVLGRVEAAMARLRPKDREVLRLILWDGLSHDEASVVLGCSANAVEHRFRRARQRVSDALSLSSDPVPTRQWRTQP